MQMCQILHFQAILQIDLLWPLTFICDLWPHEHVKFPHYINKPSLVPIRLQLFKWDEFYILGPSYNLTSDDLWPWYMTFDHMNIQRVPYCINKPSLVPIRLPTFQMRPLSHFQPILQLDLRWPLTSLINAGSHVASMTQLWLKSIKACGR